MGLIPSFAVATSGSVTRSFSSSSSSSSSSYECPSLSFLRDSFSSSIQADPSYYRYSLCRCKNNFFGQFAHCEPCPTGCRCKERVIQDCYPAIIDSNELFDETVEADPSSSSSSSSLVFLACKNTLTGKGMCNPDGIDWPGFSTNLSYLAHPSADVTNPPSEQSGLSPSFPLSSPSYLDMTGWCLSGHTGRLCSQCSSSFYSVGHVCESCMDEGTHIVLLIINLIIFAIFIVFLFAQSNEHLGFSNHTKYGTNKTYMQPDKEGNNRINSHAIAAALGNMPTDSSPAAAGGRREKVSSQGRRPDADSDSASSPPPAQPGTSSSRSRVPEDAGLVKLLLFHCQQLGVLLRTSSSLPSGLANLFSGLSSGSGFSLHSLFALECINKNNEWGVAQQLWLSLAAPASLLFVGFISLTIYRHRASRSWAVVNPSSFLFSRFTSYLLRLLATLMNISYLLIFPCLQLALDAISCTDTRQANSLTSSSSSSYVFLNSFPYQACDAIWAERWLPPAMLSLLFWLIFFPIFSTYLLKSAYKSLSPISFQPALPFSGVGVLTDVDLDRQRGQKRHASISLMPTPAASAAAIIASASGLMLSQPFPSGGQEKNVEMICRKRNKSDEMITTDNDMQQQQERGKENESHPDDVCVSMGSDNQPDDINGLPTENSNNNDNNTTGVGVGGDRDPRVDDVSTSSLVLILSAVTPLTLPYRRRYMYWEQVVLARRILLLLVLSLVPSYTPYLSLGMFFVVQLSALLQHWAAPYCSIWANRVELSSLYLLLINYLTSLILQQQSQATSVSTTDLSIWTGFLLFINLAWIVCVLGLIAIARVPRWMEKWRQYQFQPGPIVRKICCCCWKEEEEKEGRDGEMDEVTAYDMEMQQQQENEDDMDAAVAEPEKRDELHGIESFDSDWQLERGVLSRQADPSHTSPVSSPSFGSRTSPSFGPRPSHIPHASLRHGIIHQQRVDRRDSFFFSPVHTALHMAARVGSSSPHPSDPSSPAPIASKPPVPAGGVRYSLRQKSKMGVMPLTRQSPPPLPGPSRPSPSSTHPPPTDTDMIHPSIEIGNHTSSHPSSSHPSHVHLPPCHTVDSSPSSYNTHASVTHMDETNVQQKNES